MMSEDIVKDILDALDELVTVFAWFMTIAFWSVWVILAWVA